jgi:hypothetical protein
MAFFRLIKMAALGIALIVGGMVLVCASVIFLLLARREDPTSEESFAESTERLDHHVREAQGMPRDFEDGPAPADPVPDDRGRDFA